MRLTPLDIREQQFRRVMRGMEPEEVTAFLASVASEFEVLLTENKELKQRLGTWKRRSTSTATWRRRCATRCSPRNVS